MNSQRTRIAKNIVRNHRLVMVIGLAVVGLLLVFHAVRTPEDVYGPDGKRYEQLGYQASQTESLFARDNFTHCYWSPGWVAGIGALYRITGRQPLIIRLCLVAMALIGAWLVYLMAMRLAGPLAGVVAGLVFILSSHVRMFTVYLQYEIPVTVLVLAVVYLVIFRHRGGPTMGNQGQTGNPWLCGLWHILSGLVMGWVLLMSPRVLILLPLIFTAIWLENPRRRFILKTVAMCCGVMLVMVPWSVRNLRYYGEFIPLTSNGGINLYIGNNPLANNRYYFPDENQRPAFEHYESHAWARQALEYMVANPWLTLKRFMARFLLFWNPHYLDQFFILGAFLAGTIRYWQSGRKRPSDTLWLLGTPLLMSLFHMVFFFQWRYFIIILPYVCVIAAVGIVGSQRDPARN